MIGDLECSGRRVRQCVFAMLEVATLSRYCEWRCSTSEEAGMASGVVEVRRSHASARQLGTRLFVECCPILRDAGEY